MGKVVRSSFRFDEGSACKQCLLPEPFAHLNREQICRECANYRSPVLKGINALKKEFEAGGKSGYDCMVAISGGRDSMYALYVAKNLLNLRTLAFNYNNEFVHEQAIANMETACRKLGVDFCSVVSKRNICRKIVADQLKIASPFGPEALSVHLCGPCNVGGFLAAKKTALKKRIPVIITGTSQEERLPEYLKAGRPIPFTKKITGRSAPYFFRVQIRQFLQRLEFSTSLKEVFKPCFAPKNDTPGLEAAADIRIVPLYDYIRWDRRKIVRTIEKELGWRKPEGMTSSWRFDCRLKDLINYLWYKRCGYPKVFFGYVQMIRSGTMTKKEALEQLSGTDWGEFTREMEDCLISDLNIGQKHIDIIKAY